MKNFKFVEGKNGLNFNEFLYLKDMFKLLKCGVELEFEFNEDMEYRVIREAIGDMESNYDVFGNTTSGVASVKPDGSLENGVEVVTNGRLFHTPYLHYCQYKKIFEALNWEIEKNPRTGLHMHFLIATGGNNRSNLEVPLNLLFVKNFLTLCKKYLPAMLYLTSSNYHSEDGNVSFTRYSGFSKSDTLYDLNINEIETVGDLKEEYIARDGRYQCINLNTMKIKNREVDGEHIEYISNFHVEFRLADGALCPSQVTLIQFMYKGLIELALECSLIGELEDCYSGVREFVKKFKNNPSGNSYPSTSNRYSKNTLTDMEFIALEKASKTFINDIKDYIDEEVVKGLELIVECPVGTRAEDVGDAFMQLDEQLNVFKADSGLIKHDVIKALLGVDTTSLSEVLITAKEESLDLDEVDKTIKLLKKIERFGGKSW